VWRESVFSSESMVINLGVLPEGMYLLRIDTAAGNTEIHRIIKSK
jgi:hypothetical protein